MGLVSFQDLIYISITIKLLLQVLINHPIIMGIINSSQSQTSLLHNCQGCAAVIPTCLSWVYHSSCPWSWMPAPLFSFLWYGLPYTHSHMGIKVRSIIILYFDLLIVPQGLGFLFLLTYSHTYLIWIQFFLSCLSSTWLRYKWNFPGPSQWCISDYVHVIVENKLYTKLNHNI